MILNVPLEKVQHNPWQTRYAGGADYIKELALDILKNGLLQTPVGRLVKEDGIPADFNINDDDPKAWGGDPGIWHVQLAFGHNRLEAFNWLLHFQPSSGIAGDWSKLPVDVRLLSDEQMALLAWSENEKRRDLSPVERALAIQKRLEDFGWTHKEASERLGISRPAISNSLRLLDLPEGMQSYLHHGEISERQALALLPLYSVDRQAAFELDFGFTIKAIENMALEGYSSELVRQRVSEAVERLEKSIQPELPEVETNGTEKPIEHIEETLDQVKEAAIEIGKSLEGPIQTINDLARKVARDIADNQKKKELRPLEQEVEGSIEASNGPNDDFQRWQAENEKQQASIEAEEEPQEERFPEYEGKVPSSAPAPVREISEFHGSNIPFANWGKVKLMLTFMPADPLTPTFGRAVMVELSLAQKRTRPIVRMCRETELFHSHFFPPFLTQMFNEMNEIVRLEDEESTIPVL